MGKINFTYYRSRAEFGDIEIKDTFLFDGMVYMKTKNLMNTDINCVCLETGKLHSFGDSIEVNPVIIQATIKECE